MTVLTLNGGGLEPLVLSDIGKIRSFGWVSGAPRSVVHDAAGADGEIDTSEFRGAGSVTIGLRLLPGPPSFEQRLRRLRAFTHSRLRSCPVAGLVSCNPELTIDWEDGDSPEMMATLSQGTVISSLTRPTHRDVVVQFSVPYGVVESSVLHVAEANASGNLVTGREYDLEYDRQYPAAEPLGAVEVTNAGDRDAYPLIRMYGPWSGDTSIINDTTGQLLKLTGTSVLAGQYLELDTRAKTILLNSDPLQSRYQHLVFPDSSWWVIHPGTQRIRFLPTTFTAPARAQIQWRDAYA